MPLCRATNAEEFLDSHRNIQRLLTPDSYYVVRTSKYNQGARSMNVSALRPPSLLGTGDDTQLEAEKRQLKERQNEHRQVTCLTGGIPLRDTCDFTFTVSSLV